MPEILNQDHSVIIVGSGIDQSSERIIRYLSARHGVNINAATFSLFQEPSSGAGYVARVFLAEPDEVQQRSQRGSESKRQPNRTVEELLEMADRAGIGQLCRDLTQALVDYLQRGTTRSSITFSARFGNSTKVVVGLIPGGSSESSGLRFQLYLYRLEELLGRNAAAIEAHLPESREEWQYYSGADKDYSGTAGYFKTGEEIARFVALFRRGAGAGAA